jgi:putative endonuclease
MAQNQLTGREGEDSATHYLLLHGYSLIARNERLGRDEIDIIAYDPEDDVIAFIEVKARSQKSDDFRPELNFTHKKKRRILRAARKWVSEKQVTIGYRLDLITVTDGKVTDHFKEVRID